MLIQTRQETAHSRHDFPSDFIWGVATSAYQIEGASDIDGRGPSVWDAFCEQEGKIADSSSGRIACDHYHLYHQDLDLMAGLGVNAYRFPSAGHVCSLMDVVTGMKQV